MNFQDIQEQLYAKYITPMIHNQNQFIGVEIELPIVNLNKEAVDFSLVDTITRQFIEHFHFQIEGIDDQGYIYTCIDPQTKDILSYDCSFNNLELSFGKGKTIQELDQRFRTYYVWLQDQFQKHNYTLTGMGINPYRQYNHNVPIENERYRMLFEHLASYTQYSHLPMYFHSYPTFGTFSSASQVQLDVNEDNVLTVLRAFSKLEPIKALLFSNSVLLGDNEDNLCARDMFWENSTHGINPHNIGMYEPVPTTMEELQRYIETTSLYCVMRDGKYIHFPPTYLRDYYAQETIQGKYHENGAYHTIEFKPALSDLDYLRTFKFEDITYRGTVEFRSVCCQPVADSMCSAALHTGLMNNLDKLDTILEQDTVLYHQGYSASELRKFCIQKDLPTWIDQDQLYALAKSIVDIAKEGLEKRGYHEESYLEPLYQRIQKRTNPAKTMLESPSLEDVILAYAKL